MSNVLFIPCHNFEERVQLLAAINHLLDEHLAFQVGYNGTVWTVQATRSPKRGRVAIICETHGAT
jgi:hypothetical protein